MIKEIPKYERPREKLLLNGVKSLSNSELLAIIIKSGTKGKSAIEIANEILNNINSLKDLKDMELLELIKVKGLGEVKAMEIIASIELGKRIILEKTYRKELRSAKEIFEEYKHDLKYDVEHFIALYFDNKCHLICKKELFVGDNKVLLVKPNEIFKYALKIGSQAVVVIHNHPSGDPTPSNQDIIFTKSLVKMARATEIVLLDHIIIGDDYYFFNENNKIVWYNIFGDKNET